MKKTKILLPAIGMLLLSTAASVTGTVAWFSANQTVSAEGMKVKAKAEEGIAIANEDNKAANSTNYSSSAVAAKTDTAVLLPTSTSTLTTWYHNNNNNPSASHDSVGAYETIDSNNYDEYFVVHNFYVRNTTATAKKGNLKFDNFLVSGSAASEDLNKSLRTAIKVTNVSDTAETAIYAPLGGDANYNVFAGVSNEQNTYTNVTPVTTYTTSGLVSLPANTSIGTLIQVYIWFEGEDSNCTSDNIKATLDELTVSFKITCSNVVAAA